MHSDPCKLLCTALLTSSCDRRFTGLLLATKFLPAGDATAVKAVHDAVGIAFIQRLLLSLSSSQVRDTASHTQRHCVWLTLSCIQRHLPCIATWCAAPHGHAIPSVHNIRQYRHLKSSRRCAPHRQGWVWPFWQVSAGCQSWRPHKRSSRLCHCS